MTGSGRPGLVSVIMPAYCRADVIGPSIRSVLAQTYRDWELIVVDDGSTDDTLAVLQRFAAEDERVRVVAFEQNQGRSAARNAALDVAEGEFLTMLDSDDLFAPTRLERLVAAARAFPADDIFIDDVLQFDQDEHGTAVLRNRSVFPTGVLRRPPHRAWVFGYMLWSASSKLFVRRSLVEYLGVRYPTDLDQAEDYVVTLHLLFGGRARRAIRVAEPLYWYRRPVAGRRDADWLLEQMKRAMAEAERRVGVEPLARLRAEALRFHERHPDDGEPSRRFDWRNLSWPRIVFIGCWVGARVVDAPRRASIRDELQHALNQS